MSKAASLIWGIEYFAAMAVRYCQDPIHTRTFDATMAALKKRVWMAMRAGATKQDIQVAILSVPRRSRM